MDKMQANLDVVMNQQKSVTESVEFYGNKIDEFTKKMVDFEKQLRVIPKLESTVATTSSDLNNLQIEVDHIQQQARLSNLEINGIPENHNEKLPSIINNIFNILEEPDVGFDSCFRVPHIDSKNRNSRSIIVRMNSRAQKDNVLASIRKRRGLRVNEIGFAGDSPIFINDHLTSKNKQLYRKTRLYAKSSGATCWTRDCKIFVRFPQNGKILHVTSDAALAAMQTSL
ncbi:uncharacterized protein LOC111691963 [Anoplophora glabripennis]|uniref:uncharacterized protein LOC111691544 n=1 Tax=Anoplophora glabripennis TaxID=217634 RepID=UPI000C764213|nr:uncharacterized protein LOC111691544 [Anoplophora glabripennis]XP_023311302.1 uncharacterized protein LOC111691963 [Anoplophora glabripennis]